MPISYPNLFKTWIRIRTEHLVRYAEQMQSFVDDARDDYTKSISRRADELGPAFRDEFLEDASDGYHDLNELFPNILRRSFFVYCYSFVESELANAVDFCRRKIRRGRVGNCGSYLAKHRDYLHSVGIQFSSVDWPVFDGDYRALRNILTHGGGYLKSKSTIAKAQAILSRLKNGRVENYEIILEQEFVDELLTVIKRILADVCTALQDYHKAHGTLTL
jgi:hypothetical protein